MKQRKYTATILMIVLLVLQSSSCHAMHFIQENLHTVKEWWDNSEGWVKGAIIGTGVVLGYVAWNERRHYLKDMCIAQLKDELAEKQKGIGGNHSEIELLKLKVDCMERAVKTITKTFWQRDVTDFKDDPSADICIELFDIVKVNMEIKNLYARVTQLEDRATGLEERKEYFSSVISSFEPRLLNFEGNVTQAMESISDLEAVIYQFPGQKYTKEKAAHIKALRIQARKKLVGDLIKRLDVVEQVLFGESYYSEVGTFILPSKELMEDFLNAKRQLILSNIERAASKKKE